MYLEFRPLLSKCVLTYLNLKNHLNYSQQTFILQDYRKPRKQRDGKYNIPCWFNLIMLFNNTVLVRRVVGTAGTAGRWGCARPISYAIIAPFALKIVYLKCYKSNLFIFFVFELCYSSMSFISNLKVVTHKVDSCTNFYSNILIKCF